MKSWQESSWLKKTLISRAPLEPEDHITKLKLHLEKLGDTFLRRSAGATKKIVVTNIALRTTALVGTAPAIMGLVSLVGTASTGTAISTLSGAAWTSSVLAWLGGSVAVGATIIAVVPFLASAGIAYFARDKIREFFANERNIATLPEDERIIAEGIEGILNRLETQGIAGPILINLWEFNLGPMINKVAYFTEDRFSDWGWNDLRKLKKVVNQLKKLQYKTEYRLSNIARFSITTFSATITKLFLEGIKFTQEDELVMQAFRRSKSSLSSASPEEIGEYIRQHETLEARQGMLNNVKGIYHEIAYAHAENTNGDNWMVELSAKTNEPGIDVWLINETDGERIPYQLKATANSTAAHHETYPDIKIIGNEELADKRDDVVSSGFSNSDLTEEVAAATDKFAEEDTISQIAGESMTAALAAGFITYTINLGVELKTGKKISKATNAALKPAKQSFMIGAALATITELVM
jgi:hypothetical protein|tara:strand:- start:1701 stop:3104 length:1404 start_codon:yes stop_codon:yes gene_type:complete